MIINYAQPSDLTGGALKINYSKTKAIEVLSKEYNWVYYGEKHYESTFTEFYQAYILFKKFKIDKKLYHFDTYFV